jgi:lipoprotein-releasing system permease protein
VQPALMNGILPLEEKNISQLAEKIIAGKLTDLQPGGFGIALGESLANRLGVDLGEKVILVTPQVTLSPVGVLPRFKRFTVVSIFRAGSGFGFDAGLAFIHLNDAQKLLGLGDNVTGLHANITDIYQAPVVTEMLAQELSPTATITNGQINLGHFFMPLS